MTPSSVRRRSAYLGLAVLLGFTLSCVFAVTSDAQVVNDPRVAEFDPSPDHWQTLDSGQPAVLRYELGVYQIGAGAPFTTVDMGKPSPEADGKIRYDFASGVAGLPLPGGNYEARVSAVGPEGTATSDPSNPFTFTTDSPCTFSLNATTVSALASGGNYEVAVSTGGGCKWSVTNATSWVILAAVGGSGTGTLAFEVQANTSSSSRSGTIDVAGQALTVFQDGAPVTCTYGLSPGSASVDPAAGGSPSFSVAAPAGCSWTAAPSESWITVTGGSGSGNGTVSLAVAPNPTASPRTGTVSVEGQGFTVTQPGLEQTCSYSVSRSGFSFSAASGGDTVVLTAGPGCAWMVASSQSWLSPAVTGGSGGATISFTVKQNNAITNRQATLTVGPWAVTVFQSGKTRRTK